MNLPYTQILVGLAALAAPISAQDYEAASTTYSGGLPGDHIGDLAQSSDGRYIVYSSRATDIVAGDTNGAWDIFVNDTVSNTVELISIGSAGVLANADSRFPQISEDGRYVVFTSLADNLVAGDTNSKADIFLVDRELDTIKLVSLASSGVQQNDHSWAERCCDVSDDGRYVVWATRASNLHPYDAYSYRDSDIYRRDVLTSTTDLVSIAYLADQRDTGWEPCISADGSKITFTSNSTFLHPDDADQNNDIFLWHAGTGVIELISKTSTGLAGSGGNSDRSRMTPDGRYVVFESSATDLSPDDDTTSRDIYLRDRTLGTTELISYNDDGTVLSWSGGLYRDGCKNADISADGRYVVFHAPRYMTEVEVTGSYLRDRTTGRTELLGIPAWWWPYHGGDLWEPQVTDDGTKVLTITKRGTPEHGTWGRNVAVFRLRDTSKNSVYMTHPTGAWWGSTFHVGIQGAEPSAPWVLVRSFTRTGVSYGGATFDIGPSYTVVDRGLTDADGQVGWTSPVLPQSAAGLVFFLEAAILNSDGSVSDSNHTRFQIYG